MMRASCRVALVPLLALLVAPAASAQSTVPPPPSRWSVQFGGERSAVSAGSLDTVWSSEIVTFDFRDETAGGWHTSVERQARGPLADFVVTTGGYRRLGDWTIGGTVSGTPDASFWYRRAYDAELSRRIVGTLVASTAYRFMDFPTASVHQVQPALTWYNPRGEVQARLYVTRNATFQRTSLALLIRSTVRLDEHVSLLGVVADGDRIFDVASLAFGPATAWVAHGGIRLDVTPRNRIEIRGGYAEEHPAFTQRTIALSYRRAF